MDGLYRHVVTTKLLFAKTAGFRTFSLAARGSGGEQLLPISQIKCL
jgi:hypothetical protein